MFAGILGLIGAAICLLLGLLFPWMKVPIIVGLCYGLAALGVTVLMRAGQVSFGHAMYACIAGYAAAFLARVYPNLDALLLIAAGVVTSLIAGGIVGLFVMRYREIFFGMLNLALSMVLYSVLGKFYEITGGTDGLRLERPPIIGLRFDRSGYETALLILALFASLALGWLVQRYFQSAAGELWPVSKRMKLASNISECRPAAFCGMDICFPLLSADYRERFLCSCKALSHPILVIGFGRASSSSSRSWAVRPMRLARLSAPSFSRPSNWWEQCCFRAPGSCFSAQR
jgi:Branched-chain amino acid transport system / permease component